MPMRPSAACLEACDHKLLRYGACSTGGHATFTKCQCNDALPHLLAGCSNTLLSETLISPLCSQNLLISRKQNVKGALSIGNRSNNKRTLNMWIEGHLGKSTISKGWTGKLQSPESRYIRQQTLLLASPRSQSASMSADFTSEMGAFVLSRRDLIAAIWEDATANPLLCAAARSMRELCNSAVPSTSLRKHRIIDLENDHNVIQILPLRGKRI